jgi:hypothetical protein
MIHIGRNRAETPKRGGQGFRLFFGGFAITGDSKRPSKKGGGKLPILTPAYLIIGHPVMPSIREPQRWKEICRRLRTFVGRVLAGDRIKMLCLGLRYPVRV